MQIYVGVRTPRPTEISMLKEGYKDTEIGIIPVEWDVVKLDSLGKIITGSTPKTSNQDFYLNGTRLWASPSDLGKSKEVKTTYSTFAHKPKLFLGISA